jgi:hypothetical protein
MRGTYEIAATVDAAFGIALPLLQHAFSRQIYHHHGFCSPFSVK